MPEMLSPLVASSHWSKACAQCVLTRMAGDFATRCTRWWSPRGNQGWSLRALVVLLVATAITGCSGMFSGTRPPDLGVAEGKLSPRNPRPNNVSTQADPRTEASHYIEPLRPRGDPIAAFARLKSIVRDMPRVTVIRDEPDYFYVECRSPTFGFVDDTEFYLDRSARLIHARAAARLGFSDFGVNRARIEDIRAALAATELRGPE